MKGLDWFPGSDATSTPVAGAVAVACLAFWLATLAFAFQGTRGLWDPDEGRYAIVARNMLDSGDYLVPRATADHAHFAKPPLAYWAMAASMRSFGTTEFATRLPNALAFVLTGLTVMWMAGLFSLRRPWTATVVWATSLLPFAASNVATTDTLLTFFETLAVAGYFAVRWDRDPTRKRLGRWVMWIAFGCGFLTKGPPALLPLLAIIIFDRLVLQPRPSVSIYAPVPMIVAVVIGLSWFVYLIARDPRLVRYFLLDEFVYRVATDMHQRNPGFIGLIRTYVPTVIAGTLPWSPVLLWLALRKWRGPTVSSISRHPDMQVRFARIWALTMLVVFSLAQSRLPLYLLPLAVPFALLAARMLEERDVAPEKIFAIALVGSVCLVGIKYYASIMSSERDSRAFAQEFRGQDRALHASELVFVGSNPSFGLAFYLHKHVSSVDDSPPLRTVTVGWQESLCHRLEAGTDALLVVKHGREEEVRRVARQCSNTFLEPVGSLKRYSLIEAKSARS